MAQRGSDSRIISSELVRERLAARPAELLDGPRVTRRAAVAAVLRERPGRARDHASLEVLLIRRAVREQDPWSGHMAFPGGRAEPSDVDLEDTAVRETREEMGLDLRRHGVVLGRLDDVPATARGQVTGMVVSPFVWLIRETPALAPNHEVDEVHWASVGELASGSLDTTFEYVWQGQTLDLPAFRVGERVVWGLTHKMLAGFFARLR